MSFTYIEHEVFANKIHEAIKTLVEYHLPGREVDLNDLRPSVSLLDTERRIQCEFLLTVAELTQKLDASTDEEREIRNATFNAAAFYIHQQIKRDYKQSWIPLVTPESSKLYSVLSTALDLTKENMPDHNDLLTMYTNLKKLICDNVYVNGVPPEFLPPDQQPFSDTCIHEYQVEHDLKYLTKKIRDLTKSIAKETCAIEKKTIKDSFKPQSKEGAGFFGLFAANHKAPKKAEAPTEKIAPSNGPG
jgi:hypothetical protein